MSWRALTLFLVAFILGACHKGDGTSNPDAFVPFKPTPGPVYKKLGDLSTVNYKSKDCTSVVSGVDNPQELIISYQCGYVNRAHTLSCSSNYLCSGFYEAGKKIEVGLAQDFRQLAVVWYNIDGSVADSESFLLDIPNK